MRRTDRVPHGRRSGPPEMMTPPRTHRYARCTPTDVLYILLYGRSMSKSVTIRVDDALHAQLKERAAAEGTTVTALITQAAHDALRDPRLEGAADTFRAFIDSHAESFDQAFPADAPGRLDAPGRAA
ncbi:toxin-antitoxin system HicB family antitoxin [Streptomyces sp. NPDC093589]|uniref:toxin-antitoxin system HicB family antitoxin n=1 Tax=Streptomyces sp. NPDC093589 TaxID=3366043 RepID=UPI00382DD2DD